MISEAPPAISSTEESSAVCRVSLVCLVLQLRQPTHPLFQPRGSLFSRQRELLPASGGRRLAGPLGKDVAMLPTDKRAAGNIERGSRCMLRLPRSTNARPTRVTQRSACQARPTSKSPRYFIGCNKTPCSRTTCTTMACVVLLWRLRNTTALAPTLRRTPLYITGPRRSQS